MLSRRVGMRHLEAIEDAVQSALLAALESWTTDGAPENPSAWLFRVAHNNAVEELRRRTRRDRLLQQQGKEGEAIMEDIEAEFLNGDLQDDLLRALFLCCDSSIPIESQVAIALKTLCGFDVSGSPSDSLRPRRMYTSASAALEITFESFRSTPIS